MKDHKPSYQDLEDEIIRLKLELNTRDKIIDAIPNPLFVKNKDFKYTICNDAFANYLGLPKSKIINSTVYNTSPKELADKFYAADCELRDQLGNQEYESKVKYADGTLHDIIFDKASLLDEANEFCGFVGMMYDITSRKQVEKALETSEELYRSLISNLRAGVVVHAADTSIVMSNKKASVILGLSEEQMKGKKADDPAWHFTDLNNVKLPIEKYPVNLISKTKEFIEDYVIAVHRSSDTNDIVWVNANGFPVFNHAGNISEIIICFTDVTSHKIAEEKLEKAKEKAEEKANELKKQQALFETMFNTIKEGVVITNTKREIVLANNGVLSTFGFKPKELIGKQTKILYADDTKFEEAGNTIFNKGVDNEGEKYLTYYKHKDETIFPGETFGAKLYDHNGNWIGNIGIMRDVSEREGLITELKLAKRKAQEREAKYRALYENAPLPYQSLNEDGSFKDVNAAWLDTLGYKREEAIGKFYNDFLHPDWENQFEKNFSAFKERGSVSNVHFKLRHKKGHYIDISLEGCIGYHPDGSFKQTYCVFQDITENKKIKDALIAAKEKAEESEAKYRALYENAPLPYQSLNEDGSFKDVNPAWLSTLGYKREEVIGKFYKDFLHPDWGNHFEKNFPVFKERGYISDVQFKIRHKKGHYIDISFEGCIGYHPDGSFKQTYCVFQDITENKKIKDALVKAKEKAEESDRLKSAFLANMSHEIRTPMNGILGFASLLKEPGLSGKDHQKYIDIIEKSGDRMLNTINDIVDISKIESGQVDVTISDINVNKKMNHLLEFFLPEMNKKNIQFSLKSKVPEQQANFKSDKEKINSILTNLIKNALKYTHAGSIEFGCSIHEMGEQNELKFYVKDTGIGISKERQKAIFDRFVQADIEDKQVYEGSGLGLAISKAYAEMLGGNISVESEKGVGSTFFFTLPFQNYENRKKGDAIEKTIQQKLMPNKKPKILIAEDDKTAVFYLKIVLREYAEEILVAETGTEAVEMCRKNPDIDIVLMDIKMPEISGYDATKRIREFNKDVFIVAQTAYAQTGDREKSIEAGCDDYIPKPINKARLLELISNRF